MVESDANIVAVSLILGHAALNTTMRYAHPDNSLKEAVETLGKPHTSDTKTDTFKI
jgi:site-specific recombinase XerC